MTDISRHQRRLPELLHTKIYKTGQTRGADDDEIWQNRVKRNSTALFPLSVWRALQLSPGFPGNFENGYIILVPPEAYFANGLERDIIVGENALVFYETRQDWNLHNPDANGLRPATRRTTDLGGQYVARIPATTALLGGAKINVGFTATDMKGAGIRGYEYACHNIIELCKIQLESLFWLCHDARMIAENSGMTSEQVTFLKSECLGMAEENGLIDMDRLRAIRAIDRNGATICPLCLENISATGFLSRLVQAYGRAVPDLTITEISLFHIDELRYGEFNHKPYNLGWGHHHCNVVAKDSGIKETISWMEGVVERNRNFS